MSDTVPVTDLKAHLSHHLRAVKEGRELVVTERGVPIARLCPLETGGRPDVCRQRLVAAGVLRPRRREPVPIAELVRRAPKDPAGRARQLLAEEREDGC